MKRYEYIKKQATELFDLCKKRDKLHERTMQDLTPKAAQKLSSELNWLGMHIDQTKERIGFAMGFLNIEDLRSEYRPSSFHKYDGIRKEMENLKLD